jgi:hypothetical protein
VTKKQTKVARRSDEAMASSATAPSTAFSDQMSETFPHAPFRLAFQKLWSIFCLPPIFVAAEASSRGPLCRLESCFQRGHLGGRFASCIALYVSYYPTYSRTLMYFSELASSL